MGRKSCRRFMQTECPHTQAPNFLVGKGPTPSSRGCPTHLQPPIHDRVPLQCGSHHYVLPVGLNGCDGSVLLVTADTPQRALALWEGEGTARYRSPSGSLHYTVCVGGWEFRTVILKTSTFPLSNPTRIILLMIFRHITLEAAAKSSGWGLLCTGEHSQLKHQCQMQLCRAEGLTSMEYTRMRPSLEPVAKMPSATCNAHIVTGTKWSLSAVDAEERSAPFNSHQDR